MTTTGESAADRLIDAVIERQEALFDALRGAQERYHRFNRSLIEGARQSVHDWLEVGRRWARQPTDAVGLYGAAVGAIANGQARALALAREWLDDLAESQREGREVFLRGLGEVREAVQQVRERIPSFLRARPSRRPQQPGPEAAEAGTNGP